MTDDVTDTPDIDDVAELVAKNVLYAASFQFVARIEAYDRATFTASVRRVVRERRWDPIERTINAVLPKAIHGVRVAQHYTNENGLILPYKPGDYVWCEVAERSHEEWYTRGGDDIEARSSRRFDPKDVVVTAPIRPRNDAPPANATHATDPVLNGDPVHLGDANPATEDWVALAQLVRDELDALWTALKDHTHVTTATVSTGLAGVVSKPSILGAAGSVAATKVKAT